MKRQTTLFLLALVCFAMLQTGCEPTLTPKAGKKVQYSVSAKNGMKTKTQYSGDVTDGFERIDWKPGDKIRIVSSDATNVATSSGGDSYDYTVGAVSTRGRYSDASLADAPGTNGLVWGDDNDVTSVSFFGSYPAVQYVFPEGKQAPVFQHMTISAEPTLSWDGNTGSPDMAQAYLLSAPAQYNSTDGKVHMDFYPVFNAFEIDLASKETALTLTQLQLISESSNLAGLFNFNSSNNSGYNFNADGPVPGGIEILPNYATKILTVNLSGKTISSAADGHVHFTILALPGNLTDITLAVSFVDPTDSTKEKTRRLKLQQNGSFITFPAFGKARLNGLALDDKGENWQLKVNDLPWTLVEMETTFSQNIQSGPFKISNAKETGDNYYPAGTRDYQVRTLDMDAGKTFFEVEFTPQAPVGGYWQLIPESNGGLGTAAFKVELWDEENNRPAGADLKGHIMNQPVKFHVTSNVTDTQRTEDHAIIIKAIFSTSITFDENSTFSADSEIQDAHRDGSFSYWRFVIPQKIN